MEPTPPIYIIGAGAIGKVLAAILHHAGQQVVLIRSQHTGHEEDVIRVEMPDGPLPEVRFTNHRIGDLQALQGPVLITAKAVANEALSKQLSGKTGNWPVVLLQNGLDIEQPFPFHRFPRLYRCVLFATGQFVGKQVIRFRPVKPSAIGIVRGTREELAELIRLMNHPLFPFAEEANLQHVIWTKAIVNCAFNGLCPLLEKDNGIFHRDAAARNLAEAILTEGIQVANAAGLSLKLSDVMDQLLAISRISDGQLISTYADLLANRPTEIEYLHFAIVRRAQQLGIADAVSRTRMLGEMIRLKEIQEIKMQEG